MVKWFSVFGLLAVLALAPSANAAVTIKTAGDVRDIAYDQTLRVKGKTGAFRGAVQLHVDEFPYDNSVHVATAQTDDKGEYVFPKVALTRNARLSVSAGPELSKRLEVFVYPRSKLKRRRADSEHDRVVISITGPSGFAIPQDSLFVYLIKDGQKTWQRLGGARTMSNVRDGAYRYVGLVRLPSTKHGYRYTLGFCVKDAPAAWGRAFPQDRACGDKRVNAG